MEIDMSRIIVLGVIFLTACSSQPAALQSCWRQSDFRAGQRIAGEAVALFSPTGPLVITSACQQGQLLANFPDQRLQASSMQQMRDRSLGQWNGGQAYLVTIQGAVKDRDEREGPSHIDIDQFTVSMPIQLAEHVS